jgi:hypothetical protein
MAESMASVVVLEPELETVLMPAEADLRLVIPSCHRLGRKIALLIELWRNL